MLRTLLVSALVLIASSPAVAQDARADVAFLNRGDNPTRHTLLGWTADGRAAVRLFVCSEGGQRHCWSSVGLYAAGEHATVTRTFDYEGYDPVAPADARAFVAAESAALAALPPLVRATARSSPASAFGSVASAPVDVRTGSRPRTGSEDTWLVSFSVDAVATSGARVRLFDVGVGSSITELDVAAYPSPDGRYLALAVTAVTTEMCWDLTSLGVTLVDIARVRAQLANTVGFRAHRAGRMAEALDRFTEATAIDPTHALAWHNRASVESRTGDVTAALASERRAIALDPSMASRACGDDDFLPLRATAAGVLLLGCGSP